MIAACVIDASAAVSLLAPSQSTTAARLFASPLPQALLAPHAFRMEVRNAILRLERNRRLPVASVDAPLAALEAVITFEAPADSALLALVMSLGRGEALGSNDAAYLETALRSGHPIATRDISLIAAAQRRGVQVYDLR